VFNELGPQSKALAGNRVTGEQYPEQITPRQLLDVRRGFNKDFIGRWNPNSTGDATKTAKSAYGALTDEFHNAVPGSKELDQRISSLIPVESRFGKAEANAGIGQRMLGRFGAHTGALAGGLAGLHYAGLPGMALGIGLPELVADPATKMVAARTLGKIAPYVKPAAALTYNSKKDNGDANR
jgi:hypothetical protein